MSVRKKRAPKNSAYTLAKPVAAGTILVDNHKHKWIVGNPIAQGGFGCIYSARRDEERADKYIAKIEPLENGPLFTEIHFYIRVCTEASIAKWMAERRLSFLGIPRYVASGNFSPTGDTHCRFLIMDRFSGDLESVLKQGLLKPPNVVTVTLHVLDALEYLHSKDYVHADIKASNLLYTDSFERVTLIDFGLARPFRSQGVHYPPKSNPKLRHNGTLEFCSWDSHSALPPSRRGDLEILLFNVVHWLARCQHGAAQSHTAGLPWGHLIPDPKLRSNVSERVKLQIAELKQQSTEHVDKLLSGTGLVPDADFTRFAQSIAGLSYDETPDYAQLRRYLVAFRTRLSTGATTKTPLKRPKTMEQITEPVRAKPSPKIPEPTPIHATKRSRGRPQGSSSRNRKAPSPPSSDAVSPCPAVTVASTEARKKSAKPNRTPTANPSPLSITPRLTNRTHIETEPTRSSPRLNATRLQATPPRTPVPKSSLLRSIFDSDEEFSDLDTTSHPRNGHLPTTGDATRKVLTPLNPHPPVTRPVAPGRRSGFCQTSPDLLLVAKAEALGRRAAELASRHFYPNR